MVPAPGRQTYCAPMMGDDERLEDNGGWEDDKGAEDNEGVGVHSHLKYITLKQP